MGRSSVAVVGLSLVLALVGPSLATDYTVGDSAGWGLGSDYPTWAQDKTFKVGDKLVFKYSSGHTVDEVTSGDYSSCTSGNSITTDSSGSTTIPLTTAGVHYFICGITGHCSSGMKLSVKVVAASAATPTLTSTPPASGTPGSSSTPNVPEPSSAIGCLGSPVLGVVVVVVGWVSSVVLRFV